LSAPVVGFPGWLGSGKYFRTWSATGSIRAAGITLPANWSRMKPPAGFARVVNGSKIRMSCPFCASVCEKSPFRCASVGTVVVVCDARRSRSPSNEVMKNVRLRRIGPPATPPNWLRR
jgi:hypothetical protein